MENKEKATEDFNVKYVIDDDTLDEIADKLYDKLVEKIQRNTTINGYYRWL